MRGRLRRHGFAAAGDVGVGAALGGATPGTRDVLSAGVELDGADVFQRDAVQTVVALEALTRGDVRVAASRGGLAANVLERAALAHPYRVGSQARDQGETRETQACSLH